MNPIALFRQTFGIIVPPIHAASFLYHFWLRYNENGGDVVDALKYAALHALDLDLLVIR